MHHLINFLQNQNRLFRMLFNDTASCYYKWNRGNAIFIASGLVPNTNNIVFIVVSLFIWILLILSFFPLRFVSPRRSPRRDFYSFRPPLRILRRLSRRDFFEVLHASFASLVRALSHAFICTQKSGCKDTQKKWHIQMYMPLFALFLIFVTFSHLYTPFWQRK